MQNISEKLVQRIRKKTSQLAALNHAVKVSLPKDCHDHVNVADIRQNQLIILTDSPVWQTRLRMYSHTMLEALHQHAGIKLNQVKIKLTPAKRIIPKAEPVYRTISSKNAKLIEQTANAISDSKLQAALLSIAKKTKQ